jgi:hypothetical protein
VSGAVHLIAKKVANLNKADRKQCRDGSQKARFVPKADLFELLKW